MNTFDRHMSAIKAGAVDATNVIGIRKAINVAKKRQAGWSVPRSAMASDLVWKLEEAVAEAKPRVVGTLHDTGLKVLQNKRYAKRLTKVAHIIENLDAFYLYAFDRIGRREEYAVPVYKAVAKDGSSFLFRNVPWQSGGDGPEVL